MIAKSKSMTNLDKK